MFTNTIIIGKSTDNTQKLSAECSFRLDRLDTSQCCGFKNNITLNWKAILRYLNI